MSEKKIIQKCKPIGDVFTIHLNSGDLYIMSEKAVGQDWKKSSQLTLRHTEGENKVLDLPSHDFLVSSTIDGQGGIGKTTLALEYVYRKKYRIRRYD